MLDTEIDKLIIDQFGDFDTPSDQQVEISQIRQIPELIKKIKLSKFGPKINILGNIITSEFKAGFYYTNPLYCEQLFLIFKKSSHEDIENLFKNLERNVLDQNIAKANSLLERKKEYQDAAINIIETSNNKLINNCHKNDIDELTNYLNRENSNSNYASLYIKAQEDEEEVDSFIINELAELFEEKGSKLLNQKTLKLLKVRLIAVWLIAESFRYPPMLFYSLILLHLYQNGYTKANEMGSLHPAYPKGSHKTLTIYYKESTGVTVFEASPQMQQNLNELRKKNFNILKTLYEGIENNLKCDPVEKKKYTSIFFKSYINYYLKLCGFIDSPKEFNDL